MPVYVSLLPQTANMCSIGLLVTAALIGLSSAARLDSTYLPPGGAKTAGGGPGLKAPFAGGGGGGGGAGFGPGPGRRPGW
ncbi:unnamed protein product [Acanthoscelides obtectus]|uniref:Uncharacterized protein n=1 Tax=Acanthoscelides obtectus TaxID=200917 RepID=A0A9P0M968_ACAOB|nr:unnamed protein product [Acanthoscelides obtectus]CAK1677688.1 hypothetical protein AOBTE_LOCUS31490 [Acanthoscelides obtectus]